MAITAGTASLVSVGSSTAQLSATAVTGATGPVTYQWYRATTTGFSVGMGNIVTGATSLTLSDTGLTPLTTYYYKLQATDTGHSNDLATYTQVAAVTTQPQLSQNQFSISEFLGTPDLRFNTNTVAVQIDVSQATALYAGAAVKIVDSADGVPKVVGCAANSDEVLGFINYDVKTQAFVAGVPCEISMAGNVLYLYATGAISRGAQVTLDLTTMGGVGQLVGSSGADIVGWAFDKATAPGQLIRIRVSTPSYAKA